MTQFAKLLSPPHNFAVVQLPDRNYPGVVVQGDTLSVIVEQIARIKKLALEKDIEEVIDELDDMYELLGGALEGYKRICG